MASAEEWSYRAQKPTTQRPPPTHSPQPGPSAPHTERTHPQNWSHNRTEEPHRHIPNRPPYPPLPPPPRHPPPPHPRREDLSRTDSDGRRSDHHTGNERDGYKGSPLDNERDGYKGSPLNNERDGYKGSPLNNERDGYKGSPLDNERDGYKGSPLDNERDGYKGSPLNNERDGYKGSPLDNERDGYKGSPLDNERDGYKGSPLNNERDGYKGSPLNNERDGYKGSPLDNERDGYKGSPLDNERDGYKGSPLNNERDGYKGSPLNNERDGYKGSPLDNERDGYKGSPLNNERDGYKGSPLDHHTRTSETKRELPDTSKNKTKPGQTVIKEFKSKTVPRFVPRQVRGRSKPLIKKHLLVKPAPAPAASVPALETDSQSEDAGLKAESWVPPRERDSVNAALKAESCVLRDVHGPRLPEPQEAKREAFKSSETGDESVDETVAAIRKRVHEVIFPFTFVSMSFPNSKKYVTYLEVRLLSMRLSRLFILTQFNLMTHECTRIIRPG